jgi:hypothetical protein
MSKPKTPHRFIIVVKDEDTGEEVATASSVETLVLLVAPDVPGGEPHRRLFLGDMSLGVELLFDAARDLAEGLEHGTLLDYTDMMDDQLLLELTDGLPQH